MVAQIINNTLLNELILLTRTHTLHTHARAHTHTHTKLMSADD